MHGTYELPVQVSLIRHSNFDEIVATVIIPDVTGLAMQTKNELRQAIEDALKGMQVIGPPAFQAPPPRVSPG